MHKTTLARAGMYMVVTNLGLAPLLGCGEPPPDRMPVQERAFALVQERFAPIFAGATAGGARAPRPLDEPPVHWWTMSCPGTAVSAVVLGSSCYAGIFFRGDSVDVAWRGSFGESAYAHELMHFFLKEHTGDSDVSHQRDAEWSQVRDADLALQERGL